MNCSAERGSSVRAPASSAIDRERSMAASAPATVSALMTPWLPEREVGLMTLGSPTVSTSAASSAARAVGGQEGEAGLGHLGRFEQGAHPRLVPGGRDGIGRVGTKTEAARGAGRGEGPLVVDGDDGVERSGGIEGDDGLCRRLGVLEGELTATPRSRPERAPRHSRRSPRGRALGRPRGSQAPCRRPKARGAGRGAPSYHAGPGGGPGRGCRPDAHAWSRLGLPFR